MEIQGKFDFEKSKSGFEGNLTLPDSEDLMREGLSRLAGPVLLRLMQADSELASVAALSMWQMAGFAEPYLGQLLQILHGSKERQAIDAARVVAGIGSEGVRALIESAAEALRHSNRPILYRIASGLAWANPALISELPIIIPISRGQDAAPLNQQLGILYQSEKYSLEHCRYVLELCTPAHSELRHSALCLLSHMLAKLTESERSALQSDVEAKCFSALSSEDSLLRTSSARVFGHFSRIDQKLSNILYQGLFDSSEQARDAFSQTYAKHGEAALKILIQNASNAPLDPEVRKSSAAAIGSSNVEKVKLLAALDLLATSPHSEVREGVCDSLKEDKFTAQETVPRLCQILACDPEHSVRLSALYALRWKKEFPTSDHTKELDQLMVATLSSALSRVAIPNFERSELVRAVSYLGEIDQVLATILKRMLATVSPLEEHCNNLIYALAKVPQAEVELENKLWDLSDTEDAAFHESVISTLVEILSNDESAVHRLIARLKSDNINHACVAVGVLGKLARPGTMERVAQVALEGSNILALRISATRALIGFGLNAGETLLKILDQMPEKEQRVLAVELLGALLTEN